MGKSVGICFPSMGNVSYMGNLYRKVFPSFKPVGRFFPFSSMWKFSSAGNLPLYIGRHSPAYFDSMKSLELAARSEHFDKFHDDFPSS